MLRFTCKNKYVRIGRNFLKKITERPCHTDMKIYYEVTLMKMEWQWSKHRHSDQRNRTESTYENFIYDKGDISNQWVKNYYSIDGTKTADLPFERKTLPQNNFKTDQTFNYKADTTKVLTESTYKSFLCIILEWRRFL